MANYRDKILPSLKSRSLQAAEDEAEFRLGEKNTRAVKAEQQYKKDRANIRTADTPLRMGSMKNVDAGTGRGTTAFGSDKTFKQAFAEARKAKQDVFDWKGKTYTTEMAGEKKSSDDTKFESSTPDVSSSDEGTTTSFKRGGRVKMSSASKRGDGCAQRGKTRGKMV